MAVYLLKGAGDSVSMTSISVSAIALLIFLRIQSLRERLPAVRAFVRKVFFAMIALITLIVVHSVVMFSEHSFFGFLITKFGRDITLTDRTNIWHDVYAAASGNPLFGVGFGGFWIGRLVNIPWAARNSWILAQGHSGYADSYLQLGWVGIALLANVLFSTPGRLLDLLVQDFNFGCFRITMFLVIMYVNITESTYLRGDHHLWFIFMLVIWILPNNRTSPAVEFASRESKQEPEPVEVGIVPEEPA
jgi:O-antigen ligase